MKVKFNVCHREIAHHWQNRHCIFCTNKSIDDRGQFTVLFQYFSEFPQTMSLVSRVFNLVLHLVLIVVFLYCSIQVWSESFKAIIFVLSSLEICFQINMISNSGSLLISGARGDNRGDCGCNKHRRPALHINLPKTTPQVGVSLLSFTNL